LWKWPLHIESKLEPDEQFFYTRYPVDLLIMSLILVSASTTAAASSAVSITTAISVGVGGALIAILLIMLLSSRELISASNKSSKKVLATLDSAIVPLLVVFSLTIVFQVLEIVGTISV